MALLFVILSQHLDKHLNIYINSSTWDKDTQNALLYAIFISCQPPFFFCLFRAASEAYGGSEARDQIGAVATGLHHSHSNARSELCL